MSVALKPGDLDNIGLTSEGRLECRCTGQGGAARDWCEHLERVITAGEDAIMLHTDHHIIVPIFPTADVFVEVWIGEDIGNGSAIMSMGFTPDIGRPYSVRLGFWNPGEGMGSIRGVIIDYLRSQLEEGEGFGLGSIISKCPATVHNMRASRIVHEKSVDQIWKVKCLWNMVMEKACTPCLELSSGINPLGGI